MVDMEEPSTAGAVRREIRLEVIRTVRRQFRLDWRGIHGVPHWARVRWNWLAMAPDSY